MKNLSKTKKSNLENFKNLCKKEITSDTTNNNEGLPEFIFYCNLIVDLCQKAAKESKVFSEVSDIYCTGASGKGFDIVFKKQPKNIKYIVSDNVLQMVITIEFENKENIETCYKTLCKHFENSSVKFELKPWGIDIYSTNNNIFEYDRRTEHEYRKIYSALAKNRSVNNQNKVKNKLIKTFRKFSEQYLPEINEVMFCLLKFINHDIK